MWKYIFFLLIVVFITWGIILYLLWRQSLPTVEKATISSQISKKTAWVARQTRKVRFFVERLFGHIKAWLGEKIARLFFFFFPSAKEAFKEKDELTGFSTGPSSYFLMSVSAYKEQVKKKKAGRKKKIV